MTARVIPILRAESLIPPGLYCYTPVEEPSAATHWHMRVARCPFWRLDTTRPRDERGHCDYLRRGDADEDGTSLLWDGVKECGVRTEDA